jgi:Tfp pilus assembly protein PilP
MRKHILQKPVHALLLIIMLALSGCSIGQSVQPWEKETLARPEMTFEGDPLDTKYVEHIYSSKEGASGGAGVGGGGCGCN